MDQGVMVLRVGPDDVTLAETPVLALPGNPVGAYVSFHVYVAPLLARLRGLSPDLIDATPAGR